MEDKTDTELLTEVQLVCSSEGIQQTIEYGTTTWFPSDCARLHEFNTLAPIEISPPLPVCTLALQCSGILALVFKSDGHCVGERGTSDSGGKTTHFCNLEVIHSSLIAASKLFRQSMTG